MSHMIGKRTYPASVHDRYGGKDTRGIVTGQAFETIGSKHLDVPKTKMVAARDSKAGLDAGADKNRYMSPNRPVQQNAYKTVSGASLGKEEGWSTHGDRKKAIKARIIQRKQYSMNHVAVARIMKGNVNANEGAYLHRGGDRTV